MSGTRVEQTGAPPGSLSYIGGKPAAAVQMRLFDYNVAGYDEQPVTDLRAVAPVWNGPRVTWLDIDGLSDVAMIRQCGELFGLHPLVLEDILHTDQRPKIEDHGESLFIVVKMLRYDVPTDTIVTEQVSMIVTTSGVITFQEMPGDVLDPIRERIRHTKGRVRQAGADYLAYAILDAIVDHYFLILEHVSGRCEKLENEVMGAFSAHSMMQIHHLRQELVCLRRAAWPLRDVAAQLDRDESALVQSATRPYVRDLYDHCVRVIEGVEAERDLLASLQEMHLSNASFKLNEVMKILTIISTIFIPLTFVVGIYGMNFDHMPELRWSYGYPLVMAIMTGLALGMFGYFRRRGWF